MGWTQKRRKALRNNVSEKSNRVNPHMRIDLISMFADRGLATWIQVEAEEP
jgi:hypothetical protein